MLYIFLIVVIHFVTWLRIQAQMTIPNTVESEVQEVLVSDYIVQGIFSNFINVQIVLTAT